MVSRAHFLMDFDLHLVDLNFVPKVHKMGLRSIDKSLFLIIASRILSEGLEELLGPTFIYTDDIFG
jgi:hypothetical protein